MSSSARASAGVPSLGFEWTESGVRSLSGDLSLSWWLPGHGEPTQDPATGEVRCGTVVFFGHRTEGGETHFRRVLRRCGRFSCPVCSLEPGGWGHREARAITDRVRAGCAIARRRPIHVVVSPPPGSDFSSVRAYERLRRAVERVAKLSGFRGGCAIFHDRRLGSARWNGTRLGCRKGPHFHLIGDGWIYPPSCRACDAERREADAIAQGEWADPRWFDSVPHKWIPAVIVNGVQTYGRVFRHDPGCGWVVKNLGVRKSVRATALYILSHAAQGILPTPEVSGVAAPRVVVWFGSMSYRTLKIEPPGAPPAVCAVCKAEIPRAEWFELVWEGTGPPPPEDSGTCHLDEWRVVTPGHLNEEDLFGGTETRADRARRELGPRREEP